MQEPAADQLVDVVLRNDVVLGNQASDIHHPQGLLVT